jgi:hypothetical protein
MKLTTFALIAATLAGTAAMAATPVDSVLTQLTQSGYSNVTVEQIGQVYKIKASLNGQTRELVYDAQTGKLLSDRLDTNGDGLMDKVLVGPGGGSADNDGAGPDNDSDSDNNNGSRSSDRDSGGSDRNGGSDRDNGGSDNDG